MKTLDRSLWTTFLDGFRNLRTEGWPVVQRLDPEELDQGVEFIDIVLHGSASQTPSVLALEGAAGDSTLSITILDRMGFI